MLQAPVAPKPQTPTVADHSVLRRVVKGEEVVQGGGVRSVVHVSTPLASLHLPQGNLHGHIIKTKDREVYEANDKARHSSGRGRQGARAAQPASYRVLELLHEQGLPFIARAHLHQPTESAPRQSQIAPDSVPWHRPSA